MLVSGACLVSLHQNKIPKSTHISTNKLHEIESILNATEKGNKLYQFIYKQNNIVHLSNKALKSGMKAITTLLWCIIAFSIINLYFIFSWKKTL